MKNKTFIPIMLMLVGTISTACANSDSLLNSSKGLTNTIGSDKQIEVEAKIISDSSIQLETNIRIPLFSGVNRDKLLNELNILIEREALNIKKQTEKIAKEELSTYEDEGKKFLKYELMIDHKVHTINPSFVSMTVTNYQYTGGAHGFTIKTPYNFNLVTGKEITFEDLFKENSDYKKVINKEIQKQIKKEPNRFFPDEVELFSGINDKQSFYIEDGKLVIYFGLYEIAPYSSGIVEFEIPNSVLNNIACSPLIK